LLPGLRDCVTDDDIAMHFLRNSEGFEKYLQYLIGQLQAESVISEKEVHQYFKVGLQNTDRIVMVFWGHKNCIRKKRDLIKIKVFIYIIYVCTVYIYDVYIINTHTHACINLRKICYVSTFKIFVYNINYMNINIYMEIFSKYILYVCVFIYT